MELARMRVKVRNSLGIDEQDWPKEDVDEWLNASFDELVAKFPFRETDFSVTFQTIAGEAKYTMPANFESLKDIAVLNPQTLQYTVLLRSTKVNYDNSLNLQPVNPTPIVVPLEYTRDNNCIILWPTPNSILTLKLRYEKTLAAITDSNPIVILPKEWHEIIVYGAIWRGFIELGDFQRSSEAQKVQRALIASTVPVESKEEFDTHLGGVEVYASGFYSGGQGRQDWRR